MPLNWTSTEFSDKALDDFIAWLEKEEALPDGLHVCDDVEVKRRGKTKTRKPRGSGNQDHAPGDLWFSLGTDNGLSGRYCLEHKATEKKQRSFSMKELTKLRMEAHSVGRIPAFGVSFYDAATGRFTHLISFF